MSLDTLNHIASLSWRLRTRRATRLYHNVASSWSTVANWHARSKQRLALLSLDDRMLKDVGVTRAQAEAEAAKPFWRN